jgi:hypothetical protein
MLHAAAENVGRELAGGADNWTCGKRVEAGDDLAKHRLGK